MVQYNDGIPFSYLRKQLIKKHKRTKKRPSSPNRKKRKEKKRTKKRPLKIPKGVIIRKKGKLYKSNGNKLQRMTHNRI
jgi:hypothetical protein